MRVTRVSWRRIAVCLGGTHVGWNFQVLFARSPPTVQQYRHLMRFCVVQKRNPCLLLLIQVCKGSYICGRKLFFVKWRDLLMLWDGDAAKILKMFSPDLMGTAVAQWLRCCATNRKVAGSIPDGITGIFHWNNPSDRSMALGSTQPLTEMSTRSISWG